MSKLENHNRKGIAASTVIWEAECHNEDYLTSVIKLEDIEGLSWEDFSEADSPIKVAIRHAHWLSPIITIYADRYELPPGCAAPDWLSQFLERRPRPKVPIPRNPSDWIRRPGTISIHGTTVSREILGAMIPHLYDIDWERPPAKTHQVRLNTQRFLFSIWNNGRLRRCMIAREQGLEPPPLDVVEVKIAGHKPFYLVSDGNHRAAAAFAYNRPVLCNLTRIHKDDVGDPRDYFIHKGWLMHEKSKTLSEAKEVINLAQSRALKALGVKEKE